MDKFLDSQFVTDMFRSLEVLAWIFLLVLYTVLMVAMLPFWGPIYLWMRVWRWRNGNA